MCWQFVLAVLGSQFSFFMVLVEGGRVLLSHGGGLELSLMNVYVTAKVHDKISGLRMCSLFNTTNIKYSRPRNGNSPQLPQHLYWGELCRVSGRWKESTLANKVCKACFHLSPISVSLGRRLVSVVEAAELPSRALALPVVAG